MSSGKELIFELVKQKNLKLLFGNLGYEFVSESGQGGEAKVYRFKKEQSDYAIRIIDKLSSDRLVRYKQEIKNVQSLSHPNIIKPNYRELKDGEDEIFYSIMPYYPDNLRNLIPLLDNVEKIFDLIVELGEAIKYIHKNGIIHRDLKPENILISEDGHLVLTDFGIAHFKDSTLTKKSDLLNNRVYLAPEQYAKGNAQSITPAADVYSFGLIINECFTKRVAHGDNYRLISDKYPYLFEFDNIVKKMLRQDAEKRISISCALSLLKESRDTLSTNLTSLSSTLINDAPEDLSKETLKNIQNQASKDVYFATYFKLDDPIKKYELNYHKNIGFSVTSYLKNLAARHKILEICRNNFIYESRYDDGPSLSFLDESENKELYKRLDRVLSKYPVSENKLYGEITKYFSTCLDYHAEEILSRIEDEKQMYEQVFYHIQNAPILWLITFLLELGIAQSELENNIVINWDRTSAYDFNETETSLFREDTEFDKSEYEYITLICQCLIERWNLTYDYLDDKTIRFIFADKTQFEEFKRYAKSVTKSDRELALDFDVIVNKAKYIDDEIIIDLDTGWDIRIVLVKILDKRNILLDKINKKRKEERLRILQTEYGLLTS